MEFWTWCKPFRQRALEFLLVSNNLPRGLWWIALLYHFVMSLLVFWLFIVNTRAGAGVSVPFQEFNWHLQLFTGIVWSVEFIVRLVCCVEADNDEFRTVRARCRGRLRHLLSISMICEIIAILSLLVHLKLYNEESRVLSALRVFVLFRIDRTFGLFGPVLRVVYAKGELLLASMGIALTLMLISAGGMFILESPHNEDFDTLLNSMWWATTCLTTVGYGDVAPITWPGKLLGSIMAFIGVGIFALPAGILASGFQDSWAEMRREQRKTEQRLRRLSRESSDERDDGAEDSFSDASVEEALQQLGSQQAAMAAKLDRMHCDMSEMRAQLQQVLSALGDRTARADLPASSVITGVLVGR